MNTAERIYQTLAREGASAPLRGEVLARRMEEDIAAGPLRVGDSMGSLRVLAARYGVGRSAVCEAIRILERRGLGRMRTGRAGGLVLARPNLGVAAEELADFARLSGVNVRQLLDAREAVDGAAARLAAERRPGRAQLERLQAAALSGAPLERELSMRAELARLTGNAAVRLFVHCLNLLTLDFAAPSRSRRRVTPAWGPGLADALARADGEAAAEAVCDSLVDLSALVAEPAGASTGRPPLSGLDDLQHNRAWDVARSIMADLARLDAEARLGSEWELCDRYGVGRLILRQAIRMLEDRGIVECRRGRGQGLVARPPRPSGAIRQALAFLMAEGFEPMGVGKLLCLVNVGAPALAVARADEAQLRKLREILDRVGSADAVDRSDHLELVRCVAELSDVPMVDIFCRCLVAYEARFRKNLPETFRPGAQQPYVDHLRRLLELGRLTGPALREAKAETAALMLGMSRGDPP